MFFPRIYPVDRTYDVIEDALEFINGFVLPAMASICPFDRQNFGVSSDADVYRFRDRHGHIHVKFATIPGRLWLDLFALVTALVENAGEPYDRFQDFFFDTWAAGIKEPFGNTVEETLVDLNWDDVQRETAFIDFGLEVLPRGQYVGVPYQAELPNIMGSIFGYQEMESRCESRLVFIMARCNVYSHVQLYI